MRQKKKRSVDTHTPPPPRTLCLSVFSSRCRAACVWNQGGQPGRLTSFAVTTEERAAAAALAARHARAGGAKLCVNLSSAGLQERPAVRRALSELLPAAFMVVGNRGEAAAFCGTPDATAAEAAAAIGARFPEAVVVVTDGAAPTQAYEPKAGSVRGHAVPPLAYAVRCVVAEPAVLVCVFQMTPRLRGQRSQETGGASCPDEGDGPACRHRRMTLSLALGEWADLPVSVLHIPHLTRTDTTDLIINVCRPLWSSFFPLSSSFHFYSVLSSWI